MKIVDICGFYAEQGGGVRSYVHQKLDAASRAGHDLTIVAPGAVTRTEARLGGQIAWIASPSMPFDPNYRRFQGHAAVWRLLDAARPDIVEGSSPWRSGWLAARWPGNAKRALIFHQDFVAGYPYTALSGILPLRRIDALFAPYWRHVRRLSERFDVTVASGDWLARRLAGFGLRNAIAVPFGIEGGRFSPARRDEDLRRDLLAACGLGSDGRLLLAVGRFHPEKRHGVIIEAFRLARRTRRDLGLVVVGDGLRRGRVEQSAKACGHVHLAGAVADRDHLARIYASADLLVHGSAAETYGLVVAEAIASGLAVVVPDVGGAADLASGGATRTYRTGDAGACAAAILRLLERARGGPGLAPASAEAHFVALFELYDSLIRDRRRGDQPGLA